MIDLSKFDSTTECVVPILNGIFQYNRKKYKNLESSINGWYRVAISGNTSTLIEPVLISLEKSMLLRRIKGYTYNNSIIFQNFDVAKRKFNFSIGSVLHFNNVPTFSSIEACVWEDGQVYYYDMNYSDVKIYDIKSCFDENRKLDISGVTPELKTLFLFHAIEQENTKELLRLAQAKEEKRVFRESLQGRLILTFKRVGGEVLKYSVSGKRITVDWKLGNSAIEYNSVIDSDTFKVIEAGYCMSGADKQHSATSLVLTAQEYEEQNLTYLTRGDSRGFVR